MFSLSKDRYDKVYFTFGGQFGSPGLGLSLTGGDVTDAYLNPLLLDAAELEEAMTGFSQSGGGGAGPGMTITTNLGSDYPSSLQTGLYTPQASGVLLAYTWRIYPWPWE